MVAQEDFVFRKGGTKSVRSELLLVGYPGADRELLVFRDVSHMNGTPLPNRETRLSELFLRSYDSAHARAIEITMDSNWYVPAVLNPLFAIAFLQERYQSRFELAEKNAGRDWPGTVKALTFLETAKPTLLKGGANGKANVLTRGTAWFDGANGRVLQTELQVRDGRTVTTMTTTFGRDARVQTIVPLEMRTKDPDGTALYSNFRRFDVETKELLVPREPR